MPEDESTYWTAIQEHLGNIKYESVVPYLLAAGIRSMDMTTLLAWEKSTAPLPDVHGLLAWCRGDVQEATRRWKSVPPTPIIQTLLSPQSSSLVDETTTGLQRIQIQLIRVMMTGESPERKCLVQAAQDILKVVGVWYNINCDHLRFLKAC